MNKETLCYIGLGVAMSVVSVVFRSRINPGQVTDFVNRAQTAGGILKMVSEPFFKDAQAQVATSQEQQQQ